MCDDLGLGLKVDVRNTNDYVTFCGRIYIMPAYQQASIFNVAKGLKSLPIVASKSLHAHQAKVQGYLSMDPHTPLLSQYARAIQRVKGYDYLNPEDFNRYIDHDMRYRCKDGPYPYIPDAHDDKAIEIIARSLNLTPIAINDIIAALDKVVEEADISKISLDYPIEFKVSANFVGGDEEDLVLLGTNEQH